MRARDQGVRCICPGLLGPLPAIPEPLPPTPVLDRWMASGRPRARAQTDPLSACLTACGLVTNPDQDLPTGAISLLGEEAVTDIDGLWMHADPVHLRPDRDALLVFANPSIGPDRGEADALVETFNQHFAGDGLYLIAPEPTRWYLRLDRPLALRTVPLHAVLGQPMAPHLPRGAAATEWMRLMNEAQMLFHLSTVNQRREQQRRPMINGLWTWGLGALPAVPEPLWTRLCGDLPLVKGLARLCGAGHLRLAELYEGREADWGGTLLLFDPLWQALLEHDLGAWRSALADLERLAAVLDIWRPEQRQGRLICDPCHGEPWRVASHPLWTFWRRAGLARHLILGPAS